MSVVYHKTNNHQTRKSTEALRLDCPEYAIVHRCKLLNSKIFLKIYLAMQLLESQDLVPEIYSQPLLAFMPRGKCW